MAKRAVCVVILGGFILGACIKRDPDVCTAPKAQTPLTEAEMKSKGVDDAQFVRAVNAQVAVKECIENGAFNARKLHEPMDQVAKGIMAACSTKFDVWQASIYPTRGSQEAKEQWQLGRDPSMKEKGQDALAAVLKYRECVVGQKTDDAPSDSVH